MVLTLRELLERIRPAGAPGAASEGERQRQSEDRAAEVAELAAVLAEFEAEAAAIVAAADVDARELRGQARRRAQEMGATLADRAAKAGAEITASAEEQRDADVEAIRSEAAQVVERLRNAADTAIPEIVDEAIRVIWDSAVTAREWRQ